MSLRAKLESLLKPTFQAKYVERVTTHFANMMDALERGAWEESLGKSGKFVEAALKMTGDLTGVSPPSSSRDFKVDSFIEKLRQLPSTAAPDPIRLTIPRACRFVYDIASNRGARHDPEEIDPNEMDANAVAGVCSWVLAELVRYSQRGSLHPAAAAELVQGLVEKKYASIEDVDGRIYFHFRDLSARDAAILTLWHLHPKRRSKADLVEAIMRHSHSRQNARVAVSRLTGLVDEDENGNLKLLQPGLRMADQLVAQRRQIR